MLATNGVLLLSVRPDSVACVSNCELKNSRNEGTRKRTAATIPDTHDPPYTTKPVIVMRPLLSISSDPGALVEHRSDFRLRRRSHEDVAQVSDARMLWVLRTKVARHLFTDQGSNGCDCFAGLAAEVVPNQRERPARRPVCPCCRESEGCRRRVRRWNAASSEWPAHRS